MKALNSVIISGGGTGGHINPALAIADEITRRHPEVNINFVGAVGRMEMEKVPAAGYKIDGLWISGVERKIISLKNLIFPFKLISSLIKAGKLLRKYKPDVVIGVGGFASGPILYRASKKNIPTLIQEQNSFPGITNRILAEKVDKVCAGFPGLSRWFPEEKIIDTGNPLRAGVLKIAANGGDKDVAVKHFGFNTKKPIVFIMGGSLGALSMNTAVKYLLEYYSEINDLPYQIIWQCGARYLHENEVWLKEYLNKQSRFSKQIKCVGFIDRMDLAYASSDIIASRAGAMSISELAIIAKPTLLIPSPHVTEDHQTKNALSLVERGAAVLIEDGRVIEKLREEIDNLLQNDGLCSSMSYALKEASKPEACIKIVDEIELLLDLKL
jgi:UDP-N-acetylglucosamine--N-acetylmuramyl-(pentapeptide) pyrophosphoryl-undecaprenol N-acetylglucosamine transferase